MRIFEVAALVGLLAGAGCAERLIAPQAKTSGKNSNLTGSFIPPLYHPSEFSTVQYPG